MKNKNYYGCVIYSITNLLNKKCYVGSAKNFQRRKLNHISALNKNKHANIHLQSAWNKYGNKVFLFKILQYVSDETYLIECEQKYIDFIIPEYNICLQAGRVTGIKWTKEQKERAKNKEKIRIKKHCLICYKEFIDFPSKHKRRFCSKICWNQYIKTNPVKHTQEAKDKISKWHTGRKTPRHIVEKMIRTKTGMSLWPNGRVLSEETKRKMSLAKKGIKLSEAHKANLRGKRKPYKKHK